MRRVKPSRSVVLLLGQAPAPMWEIKATFMTAMAIAKADMFEGVPGNGNLPTRVSATDPAGHLPTEGHGRIFFEP